VFADQTGGIVVADSNRGRTLEGLVCIKQIETRVSAFVDPVAIHTSLRMKPAYVGKVIGSAYCEFIYCETRSICRVTVIRVPISIFAAIV